MSCNCGFFEGKRGDCVCGGRWGRDTKAIKPQIEFIKARQLAPEQFIEGEHDDLFLMTLFCKLHIVERYKFGLDSEWCRKENVAALETFYLDREKKIIHIIKSELNILDSLDKDYFNMGKQQALAELLEKVEKEVGLK
jgi:hypothetical protein